MNCIETSAIREIDEKRWDLVTSDVLPMSHRWLRVTEDHWRFYKPRYLLLENEQGPCAAIMANTSVGYEKNLGWMGWIYQRLSLVVRSPFSSLCSVVVRPGVSLEEVIPDVEAALKQLQRKEKRLLTTVGNVTGSDLVSWRRAGFLADPQTGASVLDVPATYEAYLEALPRKDRQELRRIRKRAAEFNVRLECGPLGKDTESVYTLLCEVYEKHGILRDDIPFTLEFFNGLQREMPEEVLIIRGYVGDKLAGVSFNLLDRSRLLGLMIGLHYELARPCYLYFLLHDEAIRWSIEHGLQRVYVGRTNEREKQKHGFSLEERWLCYRAALQPLNRALESALPLVQRAMGPATGTAMSSEGPMDQE